MNPELESNFDEFEKKTIIRRKLLPWWIKTFCWIFMILGVSALGTLIFNLFTPNINLSFYGFESYTAYSPTGIFIIAILVFKGFAAYSLWFEKENAISICKADAIIGIVICFISMFILPFTAEGNIFNFRLEILFLAIFLRKINKIEYEWDNLETL